MASARDAKLPPDPAVLADLEAFRAYNAEIGELFMDIIRITGPGAKAEAATAARQAHAVAEEAEAEAALRANPEFARHIASIADNLAPKKAPDPHALVARIAGLPKAPPSSIAIVVACARVVRLCTAISIRINNAIAGAHSTAEMRGLLHPARQELAEILHRTIDTLPPGALQPMMRNDVETRLNEELGWAPNRNLADLAANICQAYKIPEDRSLYPAHWRSPAPAKSPPREPAGLWANILAERAEARPP